MIRSFHDKGTEDLFHGRPSKAARNTLPSNLLRVARRKLDQLNQAGILDDLKVPPGNPLEALKRDRRGQHAIRINDQFRCASFGPTTVLSMWRSPTTTEPAPLNGVSEKLQEE